MYLTKVQLLLFSSFVVRVAARVAAASWCGDACCDNCGGWCSCRDPSGLLLSSEGFSSFMTTSPVFSSSASTTRLPPRSTPFSFSLFVSGNVVVVVVVVVLWFEYFCFRIQSYDGCSCNGVGGSNNGKGGAWVVVRTLLVFACGRDCVDASVSNAVTTAAAVEFCIYLGN